MSRAYIVGRVLGRGLLAPLVIALKNTEHGMLVDAVMLAEDDVSIVFSYTRSYFHVDLERVAEAVVFLHSIMPHKPVSELFTVLGRARQGKTERYRELMRHLEGTADLFAHAAGERGLVMVCFTLPSFDVVFKVIRDRFRSAEDGAARGGDREVPDGLHPRPRRAPGGRTGVPPVALPARPFRCGAAARSCSGKRLTPCTQEGADLVFDHVYVERRMTPLNLYLRSASPEEATRAALDYGQCIRDLACTDIFPGDLLLKNFGVTRHGRVIFYDYDELCRVTDCNFRDLPQPDSLEDEMRAEAWFYVADNDVFPETFMRFLAFGELQREALLRFHAEILSARYWREVQQRLRAGELVEVLPYHPYRVRVASSA